ncbi:uncharacterized protein LOC126834413 isoform X2 [Adelges cooleyi]|uniref:uncharacterized protein LOC126834413 isoform X2 n=1 Tax=Adelges cooleyi TaxID=133065 RepID=UPI0021803687|nr:uncharacterized protein LOC126834413 isoform X2 [Adelges cooleyi]
MNTTYIFILCLSLKFIPKIKSYDPGKDTSDIEFMMTEFGTRYRKGSRYFYTMNLEQLSAVSNAGFIPKFSLSRIEAQFDEIIPEDEDRDYILLGDLIVYYCGPRYQKTITQIETIMNRYADDYDDEQRLYFWNFKLVLNLDLLPAPSDSVNGQ